MTHRRLHFKRVESFPSCSLVSGRALFGILSSRPETTTPCLDSRSLSLGREEKKHRSHVGPLPEFSKLKQGGVTKTLSVEERGESIYASQKRQRELRDIHDGLLDIARLKSLFRTLRNFFWSFFFRGGGFAFRMFAWERQNNIRL
jgi:hypothetical protein